MFTPLRSTPPALDSSSFDTSANATVSLQIQGRLVLVTHDGFTIGRNAQCDLTLADPAVPALHSVIHVQAGVIWIEVADDSTMLTVNNSVHRRMTLRHQDRLKIGTKEFTILVRPASAAIVEEVAMTEDLALLTAEELCDRILDEQTMVTEFADGQRSGWEALLHAIEAANEEPVPHHLDNEQFAPLENEKQAFDALLGQIQKLNETIVDRTQELSIRETDVLESTAILEDSQQRVSQRIDDILDQIKKIDPPNELRASA